MDINEIPIEVRAILGTATVPLNELKLGDVIILAQKIKDPIIVELQGKKAILGYPCRHKNKKGIKIQAYEN